MHSVATWFLDLSPKFAHLLPGLLVLLGGAIVIVVIQRLVRRMLHHTRRHIPLSVDTLMLVQRGSAALLWTILLLVALRTWGVNVNGIWAVLVSMLAVVGVGLLAVWTMVSNITASFFIWIWKPYSLGQQVEILPDGVKGRAVNRNLMFTELREEDGHVLVIPNNIIFQRIIRRSGDGRPAGAEEWETEITGGTASPPHGRS